MPEPQERPSRCHVCNTPTMVLTRDRWRYHRSLYFTLFAVASETVRSWQDIPLDQRRIPFQFHTMVEGLASWLAAHPTREHLP
jgi:hypothetical protein